jgi:quinol monooxygenase YgiN
VLVTTGWLEFRPDDHDWAVAGLVAVSERSRQDPGCVDYWWAEDVEHPHRFHFFECWESREQFESHRTQPYEDQFMADYVSRITGADAHEYEVTARRSVIG